MISKSFHSYIFNNQNLQMTIRLKLLIFDWKGHYSKRVEMEGWKWRKN